MPAPVTVSVDVPHPREEVFDFLDLMANHEGFNDHLMRDWEVSGPARGVGSRARVRTKALGVADVVDIEVTEVDAPERIVEVNVAQKAGRTGQGTYTLAELPNGGTRITFEFRWLVAPGGRPAGRPPRPRLHPPQQRHRHAPPGRGPGRPPPRLRVPARSVQGFSHGSATSVHRPRVVAQLAVRSGMMIVPSAAMGKPGLWAISHRWPSGSAKQPA